SIAARTAAQSPVRLVSAYRILSLDSGNAVVFSTILFFFSATPTTATYTLSLHDALPILILERPFHLVSDDVKRTVDVALERDVEDRKSTRLNSSHSQISYAVFCLKKKKIHGRGP